MPYPLENGALWRVSQLVSTPAIRAKPATASGIPGSPAKAAKRGILGFSRTSLYRLIDAGNFPAPIRPLPGIVAWRESDVMAWLDSHTAA